MEKTVEQLKKDSFAVKRYLLDLCTREVIHIGGDLSSVDVMTVLWQYQMKYNVNDPLDESRDRFVLSKGHASRVMSFNQALAGFFTPEEVLNEYAKDEGRFSMHSCNLVNPFVEVSTGSLGHGMPIACGIAAGLRLKNNCTSRVYTLMGDGEQAEGSVWEAAINAAKYKLGNLIAMIDNNGLDADGTIGDMIGDISRKYKAFGWETFDIDGHDIRRIKDCFDNLPDPSSGKPVVIVCHTQKGRGVDFMEDQAKWHTGKITIQQRNEIIASWKSSLY